MAGKKTLRPQTSCGSQLTMSLQPEDGEFVYRDSESKSIATLSHRAMATRKCGVCHATKVEEC